MGSDNEPKTTPGSSQQAPRPQPQIYQDSVDPATLISRTTRSDTK